MKIIVVGATGTIGTAVVDALGQSHEVVRVARSKADVLADITDSGSIKKMFEKVGPVDALVSATGSAVFKTLADLTDADFGLCLSNKLMGQVNLVRSGLAYVKGSFTLTSGILARVPMNGSAAISLVNAGLEGFGRAAALELAPVRVNVVSPPWVSETLAALGMDPTPGLSAAEVARSYVRAIEDQSLSGQVIEPNPEQPRG